MPNPGSETTLPGSPWPFLAPPQRDGEIGRLAGYRVLRLLGKGGMGMVFQAEDPQLRRLVALKVMLPGVAVQEQSRVRFLREARAAAALKHDHVVTIYQVGEDRGVPFLAMEFLRGKSLADWLAGGRRASVAETLIIGRQAAKGLAAAHAAGLVHRDIKPANLWLEAPSGRLKVLDFGLARWADLGVDRDMSQMTQEGQIIGTPAFMSPEQARGESVTTQSDLFSLGCVLYLLATGRPPFAGDTLLSVLAAVMTQTPASVCELNPDVPQRLAALIERMLAKSPAERPASAQAVLDEIVAIQQERKTAADTALLAGSETIQLGPASGPMPEVSGAAFGGRPAWLIAGALVAAIGVSIAIAAFAVNQPAGGRNAAGRKGPQEQPPTAAMPAPSLPQAAEPVDLLALIDIERDTRSGKWGRNSEGIVVGTKGEPARFAATIPWNPPEEYRLRMVIEHRAGKSGLGLALASGEARINFLIDSEYEDTFLTGLANIDGRGISERRDPWRSKILSRGIPLELVLTVRKDAIYLEAAGKRLYEHHGDLSRSPRPQRMANSTPLALFGAGPGAIRFHKIVLEPLGPDRGRPLSESEKGLSAD